ncbi:MAG: ParB/RepB/Spo0J family partition protein [Pseudomonadota bacterium]|uniref:ParB/RepB/Spo0J family partition protein n=1 Tax=Thermithiobacillus tepidarius TaxID=929 RepID=UPI00040C83F4|nr:ParB/RepB/Spo0J family partition protein [Thermithiobacillus tepidarius]
MKKPGLGRGLDALLGGGQAEHGREELRQIPVDLLSRGRYQPRSHMDAEALAELAASIRAQGIMQPIVVRPIGQGRYEIIAGERRWRAAQMAALERVPAIVREVPDEQALALALIENIQREDLNPIEEAQALQRLLDEFGLTHQVLAEQVGRARASVTNLLRLLKLPAAVRGWIEEGRLGMGHARALLNLPEAQQQQVAQQVVARDLSVRETERLVQRLRQAQDQKPAPRRDPNLQALEEALANHFGARVQITQRGQKGRISIEYHSLDQLDGLLAKLRYDV